MLVRLLLQLKQQQQVVMIQSQQQQQHSILFAAKAENVKVNFNESEFNILENRLNLLLKTLP